VPPRAEVVLAPSLMPCRHLVDNDGLRHALVELKRRGRVLELPGEQVRPPEGQTRAGVVPVGVEPVVVDVGDLEALGELRGGSLPFGISLERPPRQLFRPILLRRARDAAPISAAGRRFSGDEPHGRSLNSFGELQRYK